MVVTSTDEFIGAEISKYYGIVYGDAVMGANIVRDVIASVRDLVGGRSESYQNLLAKARGVALREMQVMAYRKGANGIVGIRFDIDTMHNLLICNVTGTAVSVSFDKNSNTLE
ncbi:YbjQ family protein [Paenibacillus sp. GCM10027626]|uniref:YbjQ family protein n=1 Tax=Paenibacillus sp. GCM10027626 TaxID=3273411 RepID=UPI00363C5979